jgi:tripartite-type tricarboxylate transporter receptor subunit TctC
LLEPPAEAAAARWRRTSMIRGLVAFAARFALCLLVLSPAAGGAQTQEKFDKPIRILVGFAPGGTADLVARVVADKLPLSVGQPVIVENRPGAISRIAAQALMESAPDGTTLLVMPIGPMAVVPHVYKDIPYDPVKDFAPVAMAATFQFALAAGPMSGAKTWGEFAAWAKANPTKAAFATSGAGSLPHFFGVLLGKEIGVDMLHVAYKGSAQYMADLISGQVPAAVDSIADLTEQHRAGKLRILASSGATRSTALPDVPTFSELGLKNVVVTGWFGFFAPAKTPKAIVDALNRGINRALQTPDVVERLSKLGLDPVSATPDTFARIVAADFAKWGPVVKASGFKPE